MHISAAQRENRRGRANVAFRRLEHESTFEQLRSLSSFRDVLALRGSGQNFKFIRKFIENRNKKPKIQNFRACGGQKKPLASLAGQGPDPTCERTCLSPPGARRHPEGCCVAQNLRSRWRRIAACEFLNTASAKDYSFVALQNFATLRGRGRVEEYSTPDADFLFNCSEASPKDESY